MMMEKIKKFIFFLLLISSINCIIVIPFKTFIEKDPDNFTAIDVINYWGKNIIYSDCSIGTPSQDVTIIINSQNFGTHLFKNMCDLPNSFFENNKSSTFKYYKVINSYYPMKNASIINETIYFYDSFKLDKKIPLNYFRIIYSDNDKTVQEENYEYHKYTCLDLGLQLGWMNYQDVPTNLVYQLKRNYEIIETYDISFKYNSDNEGEIIIGAEPHIYDPENYFEMQYRVVGSLGQENQRNWFLNFDSIYLNRKIGNNENIKLINETISSVRNVRILFDMGVMIGPNEYMKMIKIIFFDKLIKEGKCFEETVKLEKTYERKTIFYCDKISTESIIKNDFPTLYFEMKQFNKVFELKYKDLFREKDGKLYFLVYFGSYLSYFTVGKIFLKKYFFTFNQDTKMIGYYNSDLPGGKKINLNNYNKSFLFIGLSLSVLIIIFGLLGFFFGKLVYDKVRKKRINEVDDNYDYNPQEDNENNKENNLIINNDNNE